MKNLFLIKALHIHRYRGLGIQELIFGDTFQHVTESFQSPLQANHVKDRVVMKTSCQECACTLCAASMQQGHLAQPLLEELSGRQVMSLRPGWRAGSDQTKTQRVAFPRRARECQNKVPGGLDPVHLLGPSSPRRVSCLEHLENA